MIAFKRLTAVLALVASIGAVTAMASVPALNSVVADRAVPKDGNSVPFPTVTELGWKVFVTTGSATAIQLVDEAGNAVTDGMVHQVCLSSGAITEWVALYDSSTTLMGTGAISANNQPTNVGAQVAPIVNRVTTGEHCSPLLDVQFDWGIFSFQSTLGGAGTTHIYWRPATGARN